MTSHAVSQSPEIISRARLETLSDGLFAIVVTLLVLEIKVPALPHEVDNHAVATAMAGLAPKFIGWVISFITVCVIWLNHHRLFTAIDVVDAGVFWLNANLLFWTSFIPFPTALMGDLPSSSVAVSFYGVVMGLMALGFVLLRAYLLRHQLLLQRHVDTDAFRRGTLFSIAIGPVAYFAAAALAWLTQAGAFACYAAIALYFVFPRHRRVSAPPADRA